MPVTVGRPKFALYLLPIVLLAFLALAAPPVQALPVLKTPGNNTPATAQNIDAFFSIEFDPNIGDKTSNTSTTIPHVSIVATGTNTFDWYSFTVAAGVLGIFDIDFAFPSFDSFLKLFATDGTTLLAFNDDAPPSWGAGGSTDTACVAGPPGEPGPFSCDSYLEHIFAAAGTYFIQVGRCCVDVVPSGATYTLQVSIENHAFISSVPAPTTAMLLGVGLIALGAPRARGYLSALVRRHRRATM